MGVFLFVRELMTAIFFVAIAHYIHWAVRVVIRVWTMFKRGELVLVQERDNLFLVRRGQLGQEVGRWIVG